MTTLTYKIEIKADKQKVWELMIGEETYNNWARGFSEGSMFKGVWSLGERLDFYDPNTGGTSTTVEAFEPYSRILLRHNAILDNDFNETEPDENGAKWIGSTEEYLFLEEGGLTTVTVNVSTDESFKPMFDAGWPNAFELLKQLCEH